MKPLREIGNAACYLMALVAKGKVIRKTDKETETEITLDDGTKLYVTETVTYFPHLPNETQDR